MSRAGNITSGAGLDPQTPDPTEIENNDTFRNIAKEAPSPPLRKRAASPMRQAPEKALPARCVKPNGVQS